MLSVDKLYRDAYFIFQQYMAPVQIVKGTKSYFRYRQLEDE